MFCPRCGNKISGATGVCSHCHYSEEKKGIDTSANIIDITPDEKKKKKVKSERVESKPSFLLSYISYIMILLALFASMSMYWIYKLAPEFYASIGISAIIILLGGSINVKSSSNLAKTKANAKTMILLSLILIVFSLAIMITNYYYTITDISFDIKTIYMLGLTLGVLLLILGLETYLITGNK